MLSNIFRRFFDWLCEVNYPARCYRCGDSPASGQTNLCVACYRSLVDSLRCTDDEDW